MSKTNTNKTTLIPSTSHELSMCIYLFNSIFILYLSVLKIYLKKPMPSNEFAILKNCFKIP